MASFDHPLNRGPAALLLRRLAGSALAATAVLALSATGASAAITTFGSPLSQPATLDTTNNLAYVGTFTPVPPNPEAPNGLFHTQHWGADTAIWNSALAHGEAAAPAGGQAVQVRLEGCAQPAAKGPSPLTQMHFQDISPLPGGGARVNLTSQAFDIPVCGQNGAGGSTVSTYEPVNLCVNKGDYVDFNDEGGYVPFVYRAGVPYQVIAGSPGSSLNSFLRANGTNNGAVMSPTDKTANDGWSANPNEELMLQVVLGTGPDARYACPGGTKEKPATLRPAKIIGQTYHVSKSRTVRLGIYCRGPEPCQGEVTLGLPAQPSAFAHSHVELPGAHTSTVTLHVSPALVALIHKRHSVEALVNLTLGGTVVSQTVTMKVF